MKRDGDCENQTKLVISWVEQGRVFVLGVFGM